MTDDPLKNVTPIKPRLSADAQRMLDRATPGTDLRAQLDRPYVVKGWLDRGAVSVVYGEANVGKSFWAIDLAHHVFEGIPWGGNRVAQGGVLYVAAEGGAMFDNRMVARKARFWVLPSQVTLSGKRSDAGALAEMVRHLVSVQGPYHLIIFDTLARVMGGADENNAPDIAALMRSIDHIRQTTGAHCMLIHHSGKDAAKGARGHSSLRAAVDTEIVLSKDDAGDRTARATKQRDYPAGGQVSFDLRTVTLGNDSDGDPVTSCVCDVKEEERKLL
ncbi:MAG: AAA family ATPase [Rhodobacteraceae bacterium]|nr:AAA family ATPase [Paracoccaceae bacterium]